MPAEHGASDPGLDFDVLESGSDFRWRCLAEEGQAYVLVDLSVLGSKAAYPDHALRAEL